MDGAILPLPDLERLTTGTLVRLLPWAPGVYPEEFLVAVWQLVAESPDRGRVLWRTDDQTWALADFFKIMNQPGRYLVVGQDLETKQFIGFVWFDQIVMNLRAFGSIYVAPHWRGQHGYEFVRLAARYGFEVFGWRSIWGATPWREAGLFIRHVGFKEMAMFPDYVWVGDQASDLYFYRLTLEDLK